MSCSLFIPTQPFRRRKGRRRHVSTKVWCTQSLAPARVALLPSSEVVSSVSPATRRSARVSILTDFSSNPVVAVADRVSDPLSAAMLVTAAAVGCLASLVTRRPVLRPEASQVPQSTLASDKENLDSERRNMQSASRTQAKIAGENAIWLNMR